MRSLWGHCLRRGAACPWQGYREQGGEGKEGGREGGREGGVCEMQLIGHTRDGRYVRGRKRFLGEKHEFEFA